MQPATCHFHFRCSRLHERLISDHSITAFAVGGALVPIGIGRWQRTGTVETGDLFGGQLPADCAKILAKLLFVACAKDHRDDRWAFAKAS